MKTLNKIRNLNLVQPRTCTCYETRWWVVTISA